MENQTKTDTILERLKQFEPFQGIPDAALQWLIDKSEFKVYEVGEELFYPDMPADHMRIILNGLYAVEFEQKGETREMGTWGTGTITGVLPFSRMVTARARAVMLEPTEVLSLHRKHFTEMVQVSYELVQNLVGEMSDRIREFASLRSQNEKLMALGKLSAGLAHELNNPASAMVRSAKEMHEKFHSTPEKFKSVITMKITPEQTDQINEMLFAKIEAGVQEGLSSIERSEIEDDILDWLEDNGIEDAEDIASVFADYGFSLEELDEIHEIVGDAPLKSIMWWLESTLSLEALIQEIQESADRISSLVSSVKTYSHMDRSANMEETNIHEGIYSTMMILKHKLKKKNIILEKEVDYDLPKIKAFVGDLNQVWTNLIDNALDALDDGGTLTLRSYRDRQFICVDIQDNGSGIPEDVLSRIFDPFFTTKGIGEGTGMGLDIVKKIIDRHKGDIRVKSEPGKTVFTVCLPTN